MNKQNQRKYFEAWAGSLMSTEFDLTRNRYFTERAQQAWVCWQAAQEQMEEASKSTVSVEDVKEVFQHWLCKMRKGPTTKLTPERRRAIQNRIKDGYTVGQIKIAISNCSVSDFNMGQNESGRMYNDLTLICRNGSKLEQFIGMEKKQPSKSKTKDVSVQDQINDRSWYYGHGPGVE